MDFAQRVSVIASGRLQKAEPKPWNIFPAKAQVPMKAGGDPVDVLRRETRHDSRDTVGHSEEQLRRKTIAPCRHAPEHQCFAHELAGTLCRESRRSLNCLRTPNRVPSTRVPPIIVPELNIQQQNRRRRRTSSRLRAHTVPQRSILPDDMRHQFLRIGAGQSLQHFQEMPVELTHTSEGVRTFPSMRLDSTCAIPPAISTRSSAHFQLRGPFFPFSPDGTADSLRSFAQFCGETPR